MYKAYLLRQGGIILGLVLLDASENDNDMVSQISACLLEKHVKNTRKPSRFILKYLNILPCRSCGSCGDKTPGECVLDDDTPAVIRAIANSRLLIMLSHVKFGGYSAQLKKAVDKFMLLGLPLFIVRNGSLLHPVRYNPLSLLGIGVIEEGRREEDENFKMLVAGNAANIQAPYNKALLFSPTDDIAKAMNEIGNAANEVYSL